MKKSHLFILILSVLPLLFASSPALAVKLSVNLEPGDYKNYSLIGAGIANQTPCSDFGGSSFHISGIDTQGATASNVSIGIALRTSDDWNASLAAGPILPINNCAIPGLSSSTFVSGNEVNICINYPSVTKDTTFKLKLENSSTTDKANFTLTVSCTQP